MSRFRGFVITSLFAAMSLLALPAPAQVDDDVIRLGTHPAAASAERPQHELGIEEPRRGFDFAAFESRLQSLWFQRKTLLSDRRFEDAEQQLERIRAFCAEEGVQRVEHLSGALIAEARRYRDEGDHDRALSALYYADLFDPGRPQIAAARASVHRRTPGGLLAASRGFASALLGSFVRAIQELSLLHQLAFTLGLALGLVGVTFSLLMLARYQVALRHEIEELLLPHTSHGWAAMAGWAVIALPLSTWIGAGWAPAWWLLLTYRLMARRERVAGALVIGLLVLAVPAYGVAVALYGSTADPAVRATVTASEGEYDPDHIVKLQKLVEAHPDDPAYRFLLAGLYKNGRYFEEAYEQYKKAIGIRPNLSAAHINVGNIFSTTGQYGQAIASYRRAIELQPDSHLAWFNMHLAQSEDFRFADAEASLSRARELDSRRVTRMLSGAATWGDRPVVRDAQLRLASVWDAALGGRRSVDVSPASSTDDPGLWDVRMVWFAGILLLGCATAAFSTRALPRARRCVRCGRAHCPKCKSGRQAQEYCTQCLHLYILGDGLAPGTKSRKVYEVERFTRSSLRLRRYLAGFLPGSSALLRGRTAGGLTILFVWLASWVALLPGTALWCAERIGLPLPSEVLLGGGAVPLGFTASPLFLPAILALPTAWILGNAWRWRRES